MLPFDFLFYNALDFLRPTLLSSTLFSGNYFLVSDVRLVGH